MSQFVRKMEHGQRSQDVLSMKLENQSKYLDSVLEFLDIALWIFLEVFALLSASRVHILGLNVQQMAPGILIQLVRGM